MSISINLSKTLCEIKVAYSSKVKVSDRIKITSSACAAQLLRSIWSDDLEIREEFSAASLFF